MKHGRARGACIALMVASLAGGTRPALAQLSSAPQPAPTPAAAEQAQAMEFGIFFGGMASQYDLCVGKGLLPKGSRSAEEIADSVIEKMRQENPGPDQTAYVRRGWSFMKQQLEGRTASFTSERCAGVATEWKKMLVTMHADQ